MNFIITLLSKLLTVKSVLENMIFWRFDIGKLSMLVKVKT